jgi:integrase
MLALAIRSTTPKRGLPATASHRMALARASRGNLRGSGKAQPGVRRAPDRALLHGMRLSEALGLTWNDVRLQMDSPMYRTTKNDEPRAVFLPPVAVAALANSGRARDRASGLINPGISIHFSRLCTAFKAGVDLPERAPSTSSGTPMRPGCADTPGRHQGPDRHWRLEGSQVVDRYTEEAKRAALLPTQTRSGTTL